MVLIYKKKGLFYFFVFGNRPGSFHSLPGFVFYAIGQNKITISQMIFQD